MATQADIMRIIDYFGESSSIYQKIQFGSATDSEISFALSQIPRMETVRSASGSVLGYTYADPVYTVPYSGMDIVTDLDSNGGIPSYDGVRGNFPISFGRDAGGAYINAGRNASTLSSIMAVADKIGLAVTGINIGAKLGKKIDQLIYDINPRWWDENYPSINPQTWPSLVGESETGQNFFRTLFGIENDGSVTAYIDEQIVAQTYQMLRDMGVLNYSDSHMEPSETTPEQIADSYNHWFNGTPLIVASYPITYQVRNQPYTISVSGSGDVIPILIRQPTYNPNRYFETSYFVSLSPFVVTNTNDTTGTTSTRTSNQEDYEGTTYYYTQNQTNWYSDQGSFTNFSTLQVNNANRNRPPSGLLGLEDTIDLTFITGQIEPGTQYPGVSDIPGATQYPPTNITAENLPEVLQQLKQQYPDLFNDAIREDVLQPDGTTVPHTYLPIPWQISDPLDLSQTQPVTREDATTDTEIDPQIAPDLVTQTDTTPVTPPPPTQETPDTGDGSTSPIVTPTGSASSLWAVYNPTQAQLNSFGAWLWSSDFVEQLKKLFNDPMQAIIGVHKVFATPNTGGSRSIVCGYLDSGVSSAIVTNQYSTVNCGTVNMQEYFGNVFDYSPFTDVKLFLPFIGIVPLDVKYIMRSKISVKYTVDVITGACLANVDVSRDGGGGTIFTYSGSAIVSYPISSGSYVGVVSGALSILAGVAGTVATGGSALPATMGALSGLGKMHTSIQHSGQFTGSSGAMGHKKPYLIISRPQTRMAGNVNQFFGIPSNSNLRLGDCVGFTRVDSVHLEIPNAYSGELDEIERMLKTGIII